MVHTHTDTCLFNNTDTHAKRCSCCRKAMPSRGPPLDIRQEGELTIRPERKLICAGRHCEANCCFRDQASRNGHRRWPLAGLSLMVAAARFASTAVGERVASTPTQGESGPRARGPHKECSDVHARQRGPKKLAHHISSVARCSAQASPSRKSDP